MMKNKIALVTGATSGIGKATAQELAARGAITFVGGRREQVGEQVARDIRDAGGDAYFIPMDVTDEESVMRAVRSIADRYGRLDFAVNNAGILIDPAPLAHLEQQPFYKLMQTNFFGVFLSMKYEIQQMLDNGGGAVVNVSSVAGLRPYAGSSAYAASKYALEGMSKSAALDYASQGIRINTIAPGPTRTEITRDNEQLLDYFSNMSPSKQVGNPEDIAKGIAWLLSDEASFATGTTLVLDGGMNIA